MRPLLSLRAFLNQSYSSIQWGQPGLIRHPCYIVVGQGTVVISTTFPNLYQEEDLSTLDWVNHCLSFGWFVW